MAGRLMSGLRSRNRGKRGERMLAAALTAAGFPAHRGAQHRGGPDSPDVLCRALPDLHFESKFAERFHLYDALEQAQRESRPGQIAVVAHRKTHTPWVAILALEDLLHILAESSYCESGGRMVTLDGKPVVVTVDDALAAVEGEVLEGK